MKKGLRNKLAIMGGGNRNVGKRNFKKLSKKFGQERVVKQLDKLNQKKNLKIGLGTGAAKYALKNPTLRGAYGTPDYGTGRIGKMLSQYNSVYNAFPSPRNPNVGLRPMDSLGVRLAKAGLVPLTAGNQINHRGGISTIIPGSGMKIANNNTTSDVNDNPSANATGQGPDLGPDLGLDQGSFDMGLPEDSTIPMSSQSGVGAQLSSYATTWQPNQSLRARLGPDAQGLASNRISPWSSSMVGLF